MAAETVEKLGRELDCAVCMTTLQNPKSLSCTHSFCKTCLEQCAEVSEGPENELKCPMCRDTTRLPQGGVAGLKANPLICRVLDVLRAQKDSAQLMCDACGDTESPLSTYCRDCLHFICESCAASHAKMKILMKNHRTVPLTDIENGKVRIKWAEEGGTRKQHECEEHFGEIRRFYCRTCKCRVCRDCIVLDHTKPDHDCTTVQKMIQDIKQKMTDLMKNCKERENSVCGFLHDVELKGTEASAKFMELRESIKSVKTAAIIHLDDAEEDLLQQVDELEKMIKEKLKQMRELMEEAKGSITRVTSKAKEVILAKEIADATSLPESHLTEMEELLATDIGMTDFVDLLALKGTQLYSPQLSEKMTSFADLALPQIWRETHKLQIPDTDVVKLACDKTSVFIAGKHELYGKSLVDGGKTPWKRLFNQGTLTDMVISTKDKFLCILLKNTEMGRIRLDRFLFEDLVMAKPSMPVYPLCTTSPCSLDPGNCITLDHKERIVIAKNSLPSPKPSSTMTQTARTAQQSTSSEAKTRTKDRNRSPKQKNTSASAFVPPFGQAQVQQQTFAFGGPAPHKSGVSGSTITTSASAFAPSFSQGQVQQPTFSFGGLAQQKYGGCSSTTKISGFAFGIPDTGTSANKHLAATTSNTTTTTNRSSPAKQSSAKDGTASTMPSTRSEDVGRNSLKAELLTVEAATIYKGKLEGKVASSGFSLGSSFSRQTISQLPLCKPIPKDDIFKAHFEVRSIAAAKTGQLVFLRKDKSAVIVTNEKCVVQHEIKEAGKMYLSVSCTDSDCLFVLSAFWGSHIITITKHSLEDGRILEYVIYEKDVSQHFQKKDEWPTISNHGNDQVVINDEGRISVYSAEPWDILEGTSNAK